MEPERRFRLRARVVHSLPREDGVGFSGNQSPVDCPHVFPLQHRKYALEGAAFSPCHIFGADHRLAVALESVEHRGVPFRGFVGVVSDYVRVLYLPDVHFAEPAVPDSCCEWLARIDLPGPAEHVFQQRKTALPVTVRVLSASGLIVEVPGENPVIILECGNDVGYICFKLFRQGRSVCRIFASAAAGTVP